MAAEVLVVYYSRHGATEALARQIARGVAEVEGAVPCIRQVLALSDTSENAESGPPVATLDDLIRCDAVALGSPTRFGNMAAPLKNFIDSTVQLWMNNSLSGKPAAVFTSTGSMHGGQESTLLTMGIPLLHHGMVLLGVPYSEPALHTTTSGGSPYGASHLATHGGSTSPDSDEKSIARTLGRRLARAAISLKENSIDD